MACPPFPSSEPFPSPARLICTDHEAIGVDMPRSPCSGGEADAFLNTLYSDAVELLYTPFDRPSMLAASAGAGDSPDGLDTRLPDGLDTRLPAFSAATMETVACNQTADSSGARLPSPIPSTSPSRSRSPSPSSNAITLKRSSAAHKRHRESIKRHRVLESGSEDEDASGELVQQHAAQPFCPPLVSAAIACSPAISCALLSSHSSCSGREQDGKRESECCCIRTRAHTPVQCTLRDRG